jgi:hypothetical protein
VEGWGRAAYCSDPVVGKLCANTCDTCDLTKADPAICEERAVCGHAVYQALCPTTCASAKKVTLPAEVVEARISDLRIRVKNVLPAWKAKELKQEDVRRLEAETEDDARQLGTEFMNGSPDYANMFEEVYRTFGGEGKVAACQTYLRPSYATPYMSLYDVVAYHTPVDVSLTSECTETEDTYVTSAQTYCPRTNIFVQHHTQKKISDNSCWTKCGASGSTTDTIAADGTNDWCSGFSSTFTKETTALCIPRETCEELCTLLGADCHSIDMHRLRPLCYLNSAVAATGNSCDDTSYLKTGTDSLEFDLLKKSTTPAAPEKDSERTYWTTYTGKKLVGTNPLTTQDAFPTVKEFTMVVVHDGVFDRVGCENACLADTECYGFYLDMGASGPTDHEYCTIVRYDCKNEDGTGRACNDAPSFDDGFGYGFGFGSFAWGLIPAFDHGCSKLPNEALCTLT